MHSEDKSFMTNFLIILSSLVLIAVIAYFAAELAAHIDTRQAAAPSDEVTAALIERRIQPVDQVRVAEPEAQVASAEPRPASQIYTNVCASCHSNGSLGAPIKGEPGPWQQRLDDRGLDTLVSHAINGYNQMPARGGDSSLSDEEVRKTTVYMLEESGLSVGGDAETATADTGADAAEKASDEVAAETDAASGSDGSTQDASTASTSGGTTPPTSRDASGGSEAASTADDAAESTESPKPTESPEPTESPATDTSDEATAQPSTPDDGRPAGEVAPEETSGSGADAARVEPAEDAGASEAAELLE